MNLRPRLSYANVAATLALVLALGGGTVYAAAQLGKNDVKSKNIAKGAVKTSDLAKNAVKSPKIKDGTIQAGDLAAGLIRAEAHTVDILKRFPRVHLHKLADVAPDQRRQTQRRRGIVGEDKDTIAR